MIFPPAMPGAICAQTDPDAFFPEKGGENGRQARKLCDVCPHINPCLEYALANEEQYGVWGGTTPGDREKLYGIKRVRH